MQRHKPLVQLYDAYTPEDFAVWHTLFERQTDLLNDHVSQRYLDALKQIGFNAHEIPNFEKVNKILLELTGWHIVTVPEIVPQAEFFKMLAEKIFPATCWLRTMNELDYIEEPDMFHDVFGHVPLLADKAYTHFLEQFGKMALKWLHNPDVIALLGRIYWFTVEFGLVHEQGQTKIYGAGIISSIEETKHSIAAHTVKHPFTVQQVLNTHYRNDIIQDTYFIIDGFEQLYASLAHIESAITRVTI